MNTAHLTIWQRVKRRLLLPGGSYTHPDGYIELDFERPAGINRSDPPYVKEQKLRAYEQRQSERNNRMWYFLAGALTGMAALHYWPKLWPL